MWAARARQAAVKFHKLQRGRLIKRYKRFLADIQLPDGEVVIAHCPNPGSMLRCAPDNAPVWLTKSDNPKRKLKYTWELVKAHGSYVCVNTQHANNVVADALHDGVVDELNGFDELKREVKYGERSRIDFLLTTGDDKTYVEVKSVTMSMGKQVTAFPDSVTARGTRHLQELMAMVDEGHRAVMLFCCARADTKLVRPAHEIDPVYASTLREAADAGVELLAYRCDVSTRGMWLRERVPIELS